MSVNRIVQLEGTYSGQLVPVRYVEWSTVEGIKRNMQYTYPRALLLHWPVCHVSPASLQAQDSVQSPVAGGLSLEGTAGFPQKLREAVAASYGQLEPVYRHPVILHWPPLPPPAAHRGKAAICKQQTA